MGLVSLLFSFNGRINRAQYWGGTLGVAAVSFFISTMVSVSAGVNAAVKADPAAALNASFGTLGFIMVINALNCWSSLAIQVKRFHDRGRTGWLAAIPFVLVLWIVGSIVGSIMAQAPAAQMISSLGLPFMLLMLVCLAFFVDLGCLPGQPEANKFGDPPGSPRAPSSSPTKPNPKADAPALVGALSAMDKAIEAQKSGQVARSRPAAAASAAAPVQRTAAAAAAPSFGRRAAT